MKLRVVVVALAGIGVLSGCVVREPSEPAATAAVSAPPATAVELPTKWEYTMRTYREIDHQYLERQLNSMGELGWECYQMYYTSMGPWFFFKRPAE